DAPSIGLRLSGGFALEPEQSTLAVVSHHPQAVYFGMKSGHLPSNARQAADEVIAGTDRDPTRLGELTDADPAEGGVEDEAGAEGDGAGGEEPAMAETR